MIPKDPPQYSVSHELRKAIQLKAQQRMAAREYFIKEISNPFRTTQIVDVAMQRADANKSFAAAMKFMVPSMQNLKPLMLGFVLPLIYLTYSIYYERKEFDDKCRRGEIAYRDRNFKFV